MTKFEFLPNETLLEFFGYLNGIDIYYAFSGLNNRFNQLIRNIPLHANFQNVKSEVFNQFCTQMLLYPSIKDQIVSLNLSDIIGTRGQAQEFLSMFQLNEFSHLRSLTLVEIVSIDGEEMKSMLESLSNLKNLVIRKCYFSEDIQTVIMQSTVKMLTVSMLYYDSMFIDKTIPITHLTVSESCELETLYEFFRGIPLLKYLKIESLSDDDYNGFNHLDYLNDQAVCLRQLIIHNKDWFQRDLYELIFRQTPNLKSLTFSVTYTEHGIFSPEQNKIDIVDADLWEKMITLLIPQLKVFEFVFEISFYDLCQDKVLKQFKLFQTDFWLKQHRWYTVCEYGDKSAVIYTIPYCLNYIRLESDINIICDASIDKSKLHDNITHLNFCVKRVNREMPHYLSNIKLLRLKLKFGYGLAPVVFNKQALQLLEMSVNLTSIKYLDINHLVHIESPLILLQILKQTPNLSVIGITPQCLISSLTNDELCTYFNKLIKKLLIFAREGLSWIDSNELIKFCETFSNLEQLQCSVQHSNDLMFILEYLSKLSCIKIKCSEDLHLSVEDLNEKLQELGSKLKKTFLYEFTSQKDIFKDDNTYLDIWLNYKN
ncbi:unnamed protein product [Adineta steineri]|uniref:F-box domain-containing protein n=1 Tax=Adineta steineri TaxID=433720 RepID=A0A814Z5P7_9BILA|nr:unnamed protein product [Adineta steineri]